MTTSDILRDFVIMAKKKVIDRQAGRRKSGGKDKKEGSAYKWRCRL
jgi:hypothetical protein